MKSLRDENLGSDFYFLRSSYTVRGTLGTLLNCRKMD